MKRSCLFFCYGFIVFWGSLAIALATPIHDNRGGGGGFTCGDIGLDAGHRHFFREPASGCFEDFPGQPGMDRYSFGSTLYTLKIEKNAQTFNLQNKLGDMEDEQGVSNPVPSTLFLLGTGMIGLAAFRRKRPGRRIDARYQDQEVRHPKTPTGRNLPVIIKDHGKPSIQHARA